MGATLLHIILGLAAAAAAFAIAFYSGAPEGGSILIASIVGFLASGAAYLARLVSNLSAEVEPEKLLNFFDWLSSAVKTLGIPVNRLNIIATSRSPEGLRLIQVPEAVNSDARLLESLAIASATRDEPVVRLESGRTLVVMAGRLAQVLAEGVRRRRGRNIMIVESPQQLKSLYKLLRSLYQGAAQAPRSLAAYLAVKAVGKLVGHGLLSFSDWSVADNIFAYIPAEPIWVKLRVKRQIEKETLIQP